MLSNQVSPTNEQLIQLQNYPKDTPIVMVNIIKFKQKTESGESGQEVYARYFTNVQPFVAEVKAKLIWKGNAHTTLIGDATHHPHMVFIVEYPSVDHFFRMVSNPEYQKVAGDRTIALEYGGLIACQNS